MQRAGHHRSAKIRATSPTPPPAPSATAVAVRIFDERSTPGAEETMNARDETAHRGAPQRVLEGAIRQRIVSRLQGRVRNLVVRAYGDLVILEGECATYYTKQLAQHAAMGVLDDEQLENAIVVNVPR
jgi:osmotically-inducible protein OsmY